MDKRFARLCAILLLALVLAATFELTAAADHDCCGDDCPVCALLSRCEQALSQCCPAASVSVKNVRSDALLLPLTAFLAAALTPVVRRTRMNN